MVEQMVSPENREGQSALGAQYRDASRCVAEFQKASANVPGGYHRCGAGEGYPFQFVSRSFEQLVGYTKEQLEAELDNKFINLVLPEDLPRFASLERSIESSGAGDVAYRIRRRDGQIRWVQDSTMEVELDGERCFQCTIADITDFVQQQEEFARQKLEFETIAVNIPCGYHRCSTRDGFLLEFVSDSFLEVVGYSREELIGRPFMELIHPEDREFFMSHEPALTRDGRVELAYRVLRKDGSVRWIQDSTSKIHYQGKETYQCTLADITDFVRRQDEMVKKTLELTRHKTMLETMERNMPSGYHRCKVEPGCPFLFIGKHFFDIVGFTREEIEQDFGNLYRNLVWPEDIAVMEIYDNIQNWVGKGDSYDTSIYRVKHKDGGYRWVTDSTMYVDTGEEQFFQSTIVDITEYIDSMNEAKEQAEASSRAKSTFLFNASHDIRTPMNAIQGFAHIIEENADDPQLVLQTVKKIQTASQTLMTLMNDVLDLARIERGKEELNLEPVYIIDQGRNLYQMFAASMEEAGLEFKLDVDITHTHISCDPLKLTRVGMNMLSNARKFTPAGGTVTFGAKETACDGESVTFHFYTRDTGIGMSAEFLNRAFEQFERERTTTQSGVSGSGLGLAIIKKLTELMGGQVYVKSEPGRGTEIGVVITFALAEPEELGTNAQEGAASDFSGLRVLLVEDNEFNREIARYVFESVGFQVEEAENGVACLDKLNGAPAGHFDAVLMDIQMPLMDGYRATREIRRFGDPRIARIPIIAMTANAFDSDRQKCFEAGMDGHIGKPMEAQAVLRELTRVLQA